jgi:hypothetical protein
MMVSTPPSTRGTGRKLAAGIRRPGRNSHQGAQVVETKVAGGTAARLWATSHCTMRSARTKSCAGSSRRRRMMAVVDPNGGQATTRQGRSGRGQAKKSPWTIRSRPCPSWRPSPCRRSAQTGSASTATTRAPRRANSMESTPEPAPMSTTNSPGRTSASATKRSAAEPMSEDTWAPLADRCVDGHYGSLRGQVRTHVTEVGGSKIAKCPKDPPTPAGLWSAGCARLVGASVTATSSPAPLRR